MLCSSEARVPLILSNLSIKSNKMNSTYYLKKAKQNCSDNNYPEAYENFVNYFECLGNPNDATPAVQLAFTKLVCRIGTVLEQTNNTEELLKVYLQAVNFFPNNYIILNNLGGYLFKIGEIDIARRYLDLAVSYSTSYLPAQKNLMHCKWEQLPRWHFRMLNDNKRNTAYFKAIVDVIRQGYLNVTDIGAGCGLLSLMASQNTDANVTAIEESKVLSKLCEVILKENDRTNAKVFNLYSTHLNEAPGPCNFLVTEIFDCALFGERMLETLVHAHKTIITEENFKIVPCGARLYAIAIDYKSPQCFRYGNSIPQLLLTDDICIRQMDAEPYDAEDLETRDVKYLSESVKVFDIDFYNVEQLGQMLNDPDFSTVIEVRCKEDGQLNAIAVWFDLDLAEDITITTDPLNEDRVTCWEQAVFHLAHPIEVKTGDTVEFKVTVFDSQLTFSQLTSADPCTSCWFVSKDIISFLNDKPLVNSFLRLAESFQDQKMSLMDLNCFPLLGFLMAKHGCTFYTAIKNERTLQYVDFFDYILNANKVKGKMIVLEEKITNNTSMCILHEYLKESKVCLIDPVYSDGSLQQHILYRAKIGTDYNTLILPKVLNVKVILVYSWHLDHWNKVSDKNVFNFKIAQHMNEYTGKEHPFLEHLKYTSFSNPLTIKIDDRDYVKTKEFVTATRNGHINGLYTWFEITFYNDITFSTLDSFYFKKSCYMVKPQKVKNGQKYRVIMERDASHIDFRLE